MTASSRLHRSAVLLAICTGILFLNGPAVTSNDARPLYSLGQTHIWAGAAVTLLTIAFAILALRSAAPRWLRTLVWITLAANIAEGLLGLTPDPLPVGIRIAHSFLGQLFFSATVAIAVFTSEPARKASGPSAKAGFLRFVANATPVLVLAQVTLGVVFRHGAIGVLPHILWAFVVALFLVAVVGAIMNTEDDLVRKAEILFTAIAGVQILLGFAVFIMQAVDADPAIMIVATGIHAATGALTLAASVAMALLIHRTIAGPDSSIP